MKNLILSLLTLVILSCSNDTDDKNYNATIIGVGSDCGNSYLIKFDKNSIGIPTNTSQNTFYEINLPNQYKVNNLKLNVTFRQPTDAEIMVCILRDITYPQIFIEDAKKIY